MSGGTQLSVIIPTHNRRELLRRCLLALAEQNADPGSFEVIVADDGSSDDSAEMARSLGLPYRLTVIELEQGGQATARNRAIERAGGDVCLFVDDDIVASPELVAGHLEGHRREPKTVGIGRLDQAEPRSRDWFVSAYIAEWKQHYDDLAGRTPHWRDCFGGNLSAPLAALREVGGFSTGMQTAEDTELGYRLAQAGYVPTYLPRAQAVHDDGKGRAGVLGDSARIGRGSIELVERHPGMASRRFNGFDRGGARQVALRRALIGLRLSPSILCALGRPIPGFGRKRVWYRFVSSYAFWLAVRDSVDRRQWSFLSQGVPILMYHAFGADGDAERYVQGRRGFTRQLRLLRFLRYEVVPLSEVLNAMRDGGRLPRRCVVLTIDDGYEDNVSVAQPVLCRHGYSATVFVVSGRLGGSNDWSTTGAVADRSLLDPEELARVDGDGLRFEAHTRTHPSLPDEPDALIREEVEGSRKDLEGVLGRPVRMLAYPYGRFDRRVKEATESAGYEMAVTVEERRARWGDDPLLVPRIEVRGTDSSLAFLRKLWLRGSWG